MGRAPTATTGCQRMNRRTLAIINSASGSVNDKDAAERVRDLLQARELNWQVCAARDGEELSSLAESAAKSDADVVVAGGGDGTLNAVASRLAGTAKIFGVLPLGTLNHFAKDLNIPLELGAAVDNIAAGNTTAVDVGEVNGQIFLNNSSIGLYPRVVVQRDAQRKYGRPKWLALISALFRALQQYVAFRVYVTADGKRFTRRTPILFVGNNEYQIEGRSLGARRCLDSGRLCLYVLHNTGPWGLLKFACRALFRRAWRIKDFDALQARDVAVQIKGKKTRVAFDGEVAVMETPLRYRIREAALKVIVPAAKEQRRQPA
jgi:YegS/Rv2252/BmrU family lipid kinase